MAKCQLNIGFDQPGAVYHGGETLRGHVDVDVDKNCTCNGLNIEVEWFTRGRGNTTSGTIATATVYKGPLEAGDSHRFPFETVLPNGPVSYDGQIVSVHWRVRARADLPWAIDPKAEADFEVRRSPNPDMPVDTGWDLEPELPDMDDERTTWKSVIITAILCAMGVGLAFAVDDDEGFFPEFLSFVLFCVVAYMSWRVIRHNMLVAALGQVRFQLMPAIVQTGESLECMVSFTPRKDLELNKIDATLVCRERAVSGSGTNTTTHLEDVYERKLDLGGITSLRAGEPCMLASTIALPGDAPPSFAASDNSVTWTIKVHLDIPRWPDWEREATFVVRPLPAAPRAA